MCLEIFLKLIDYTELETFQCTKVSIGRKTIPRANNSFSEEVLSDTSTVIYVDFVLVPSRNSARTECKENLDTHFFYGKCSFSAQDLIYKFFNIAVLHCSVCGLCCTYESYEFETGLHFADVITGTWLPVFSSTG